MRCHSINTLFVNRTLFFFGSFVASNAAVSTVSRLFVLMADGAEETLVENCLKKKKK